jgi:hypothetical protein
MPDNLPRLDLENSITMLYTPRASVRASRCAKLLRDMPLTQPGGKDVLFRYSVRYLNAGSRLKHRILVRLVAVTIGDLFDCLEQEYSKSSIGRFSTEHVDFEVVSMVPVVWLRL